MREHERGEEIGWLGGDKGGGRMQFGVQGEGAAYEMSRSGRGWGMFTFKEHERGGSLQISGARIGWAT